MNVMPMLKVDLPNRMVYARIDETPDRAGDVFDYASSKPQFQAWSHEMTKLSDGKSLGNVRGMHALVAAGRVVSMDFDDDAKAIDVAIEVVDDGEMTKVAKGVYTGVSPGGSYVRRWKDGKNTRYTSGIQELSLVDIPCIPTANFMLKLAGGEEIETAFAEPTLAARAGVVMQQLENVEGVEDYRALLAEQPDDMIKVLFPDGVPETLQAPPPVDPAMETTPAPDLLKGLFTVANFAAMIEQLTEVAQCVSWEAAYEGDGSDLPKQFAAWIKMGASLLVAMATEESAEAVAALTAAVAAIPADQAAQAADQGAVEIEITAIVDDMAKLADMVKAGARNSAGDQQVIQTIHDHACALGAKCAASEDDMAKVAYMPRLARHVGDSAILRDEMKKVVQERDMLKLRVTTLEAQPAPGGPKRFAVERGQDVDGARQVSAQTELRARIEAMPQGEARAMEEIKYALRFQPG